MKKSVVVFLCCAFSFVGGYCIGESHIVGQSLEEFGKTLSDTKTVSTQPTEKKDVSPKEKEKPVKNSRKPVKAEWFDDAVFLGDSITVFLNYYCDAHPEALGNAQFFCSGSLSYGNAQWEMDDPDAVHPLYKGKKYFAEDCVQATGAKKVFVLMGINDIAVYGLEGAVENADTFLDKLVAKSDGAAIYVQSVTPIIAGMENDNISNEKVKAFNKQLKTLVQQKELTYIDIYKEVCDKDGYLKYEYCCDPEDMGIHFSWDGCKVWSDCLKKNVDKG